MRAWIAIGLVLAGGTAAQGLATTDRVTGCRVTVPADWRGLAPRWDGACPGGAAEGLGVLRGMVGTEARQAFYGRMQAGAPAFGVLDTGQGYAAGRFAGGEPQPFAGSDPDGTAARNETIRAFDTARDAARAVAARFRQSGNPGTAAYYEEKARLLAAQMD